MTSSDLQTLREVLPGELDLVGGKGPELLREPRGRACLDPGSFW